MITALLIALGAMLLIGVLIGFNALAAMFFSFLYLIAKWMLTIIDFCQTLMRKLCGLDADPNGGDILFDQVLFGRDGAGNLVVINALLAILFLAIILVFGFALVQIIRLQYTTEGGKNAVGPIIQKCLKSIFLFCLIPFCAFLGIFFSNKLIGIVDAATNNGNNTSVAGMIFTRSSKDANIVRRYENGIKNPADWTFAGFSNVMNILRSQVGFLSGGYEYDRDTGHLYKDGSLLTGGRLNLYVDGGQLHGRGNLHSSMENASAGEIDRLFELKTLGKKPGEDCALIIENPASEVATFANPGLSKGSSINYTNAAAVAYFYNPSDINYFMLFVCSWFTMKLLINVCFGLMMRLYKVAILAIVSPFPVAMTVIDDGKSLNTWKSKFLQETFSAYGVVAGMNLFFQLIPVMDKIEWFKADEYAVTGGGINKIAGSSATLFSTAWFVNLYNDICNLLIIFTGCYMMKDVIKIIQDLIGTGGDVVSEGEGAAKAAGAAAMKAGSVAIGGLTLAAAGAMAIKGAVGAKMAQNKLKKDDDERAVNKLNSKVKEKDEDGNEIEVDGFQHDINEFEKTHDMNNLTKEETEQYAALNDARKNAIDLRDKKGVTGKNAMSADKRQEHAMKMMAGQAQTARFGGLVTNAFQNTKAFDFVNKASFGMVSKKGRDGLDEQISKSSDDAKEMMGALKKEKEQKNQKTYYNASGEAYTASKHGLKGGVGDSKRYAYAKGISDRAAVDMTVSKSAKEIKEKTDADNEKVSALVDGLKDAALNVKIENLDDLSNKMQNPEFKQAFIERTGRADVANDLEQYGKITNQKDKDDMAIKIMGSAESLNVNKIDAQSLVDAAKTQAKGGVVNQAVMGERAAKQLRDIYTEAITKVKNNTSDQKTQNILPELMRELIHLTKENAKRK